MINPHIHQIQLQRHPHIYHILSEKTCIFQNLKVITLWYITWFLHLQDTGNNLPMNLFDQIPAMRADLAHVAATVAALSQIDHVVRHQSLRCPNGRLRWRKRYHLDFPLLPKLVVSDPIVWWYIITWRYLSIFFEGVFGGSFWIVCCSRPRLLVFWNGEHYVHNIR